MNDISFYFARKNPSDDMSSDDMVSIFAEKQKEKIIRGGKASNASFQLFTIFIILQSLCIFLLLSSGLC